jgi:hypothetical protein
MTSLIPDKVKDQYSSTLAGAQSAMSNIIPSSVPIIGNGFGADHEKNKAEGGHRNEVPQEYHQSDKEVPKDVDEFIAGQIEGRQDEDDLRQKFPTDESVWHGFVDVCISYFTTPHVFLLI